MKYVKKFYSGKTKFWVDFEKQEVTVWYDGIRKKGGKGLPKGFVLTDKAGKKIANILENFFVQKENLGEDVQFITFPYEILVDTHRDTFDAMIGDHLIEGHLSSKGNIVLDTNLLPEEAYKWLVAIIYDKYILADSAILDRHLLKQPYLFQKFLKLSGKEQDKWIEMMLENCATSVCLYAQITAKVLEEQEFKLFEKLILRMHEKLPDRLPKILEAFVDNNFVDNNNVKALIQWYWYVQINEAAEENKAYKVLNEAIKNLQPDERDKLLAQLIVLWENSLVGETAENTFWWIVKETVQQEAKGIRKGYLANIIANTPQVLQAFINLSKEKRENLMGYLVEESIYSGYFTGERGYSKLAVTLLEEGEEELFWNMINYARNKNIAALRYLGEAIVSAENKEQLLQYFAHLPQQQRQEFINILLEATTKGKLAQNYTILAVSMLAYGYEQMFWEMITNKKITIENTKPLRYLEQYLSFNNEALKKFILMDTEKQDMLIKTMKRFTNEDSFQKLRKGIEELIHKYHIDELFSFTKKLLKTYKKINEENTMPDEIRKKSIFCLVRYKTNKILLIQIYRYNILFFLLLVKQKMKEAKDRKEDSL